MASEENIELRPEESAGGFEPGDSYDDTFMLDDVNEYPGELPYEFVPEVTEPEAADDSAIEEEMSINSEEEIENEPVYQSEVEAELENYALNNQPIDSVNDLIAHSFDNEPISDEVSADSSLQSEEKYNTEMISESDNSVEMPVPEEAQNDIADVTQQTEVIPATPEIDSDSEVSDTLDPDFLAMLSDELNTKKSPDGEKTAIIPEGNKPVGKEDNFSFDDFLNDVPVINLSDFDAEHPSRAGLSKIDMIGDEKESKIKPSPKVDGQDAKSETGQTEKKKKPVLLWKVVAVSAAVVIFLASSVVIGYFLLFNSGKLFDNKNIKPPIAKVEVKKTIKKAPEVQVTTVKKDTVKPLTAKAPVKENKVLAQVQKPKEIKQAKPVLLASKKTDNANKPAKPAVQNNIPKDNKKPVQKSVPQKPVLAKAAAKTTETKGINKTSIDNEQPQYVVEIYSTPSKEDAEDWLGRLKAKKTNGTITTQKIRDVIWYKVRFGNFSTREQAKLAAVKLGFAQSWIDRIR